MSEKLPLQYVPVFEHKVPANGDEPERTQVSVGEIYDAPGTAKAQVTRRMKYGRAGVKGYVLVVDLNGMAKLGDIGDLHAQLQEAERLMLYYADAFEELKRRIDGSIGAEMGELFAKAAAS